VEAEKSNLIYDIVQLSTGYKVTIYKRATEQVNDMLLSKQQKVFLRNLLLIVLFLFLVSILMQKDRDGYNTYFWS
jgi:hypothetical protein